MTRLAKNLTLRTAMIGAGVAALAACQTPTPQYATGGISRLPPPVRDDVSSYTPPPVTTPAQQSPAPQTVYVSPATPAQSRPLPPLATARPQPAAPVRPAAPPPPPAPPVFRAAITGQVVDTDGPPTVHVVTIGDTLSSIAREMSTTPAILAKVNAIDDPSTIHPGQSIQGPATRVKAYVVQPGDTLSGISRRFNVTPAQMADASGMTLGDVIHPNQKLILPTGYRDTGAYQVQVAGSAPAATTAPTRVASASPSALAQPATRPATPAPTPAPIASASSGTITRQGAGKFIWPIDGRVTGLFGPRGPNQQSDGIDIAAAEGTKVSASAAGNVVYAGNDLQDFGNLVIIDHGNNFLTAYAHLASIQVKAGTVANPQRVTQGQAIGTVGHTGDVTGPELYFGTHHRNAATEKYQPFNPTLVLPER